jgi:DNA sulfur modification protein DndB
MAHQPLALPALRGTIGDWIYYSCLMPIEEVARRVNYAKEIHPDKALSALIQRSLEGPRAGHIAKYLVTTERFFNSLVLATYGGNPDWLEVGNFRATTKSEVLNLLPEDAKDALGFLCLSGAEKIFAIDGQHRLAGIRKAMLDGADIREDQLPVILVGHKKTATGLQRTRRLFTTLNKTAVPVRKPDIIALDEDDVMAIICRRLVETNQAFHSPKIAVIGSTNLPPDNRIALTTISSLYDVLKLVFMFDLRQRNDRGLRFRRPSDERLNHYYEVATEYFEALGKAFEPMGQFLSASQPIEIVTKHRGAHGGHLLFRVVGLDIVTRVAIEVARHYKVGLLTAIESIKFIPTDLAKFPYDGILWDPAREIMLPKGKIIARTALLYLLGCPINAGELFRSYAATAGQTEASVIKKFNAMKRPASMNP